MQRTKMYKLLWLLCHFLFFVILVQACAKNKLTSSWVDDSFDGLVTGPVLIIGAFKDPTAQKIYEDSFVEHFNQAGINALPSYQYGKVATEPSKEKLQQVVNTTGATAILITHILAETTNTEEIAPIVDRRVIVSSWDRIHGYHSNVYERNFKSGYTVEKKVDQIVASLFVSSSGKRIWTARSKSVNLKQYLRKDDNRLEGIFIKNMQHYKLLHDNKHSWN